MFVLYLICAAATLHIPENTGLHMPENTGVSTGITPPGCFEVESPHMGSIRISEEEFKSIIQKKEVCRICRKQPRTLSFHLFEHLIVKSPCKNLSFVHIHCLLALKTVYEHTIHFSSILSYKCQCCSQVYDYSELIEYIRCGFNNYTNKADRNLYKLENMLCAQIFHDFVVEDMMYLFLWKLKHDINNSVKLIEYIRHCRSEIMKDFLMYKSYSADIANVWLKENVILNYNIATVPRSVFIRKIDVLRKDTALTPVPFELQYMEYEAMYYNMIEREIKYLQHVLENIVHYKNTGETYYKNIFLSFTTMNSKDDLELLLSRIRENKEFLPKKSMQENATLRKYFLPNIKQQISAFLCTEILKYMKNDPNEALDSLLHLKLWMNHCTFSTLFNYVLHLERTGYLLIPAIFIKVTKLFILQNVSGALGGIDLASRLYNAFIIISINFQDNFSGKLHIMIYILKEIGPLVTKANQIGAKKYLNAFIRGIFLDIDVENVGMMGFFNFLSEIGKYPLLVTIIKHSCYLRSYFRLLSYMNANTLETKMMMCSLLLRCGVNFVVSEIMKTIRNITKNDMECAKNFLKRQNTDSYDIAVQEQFMSHINENCRIW